jgi:hypothetical protein
VAPILWLLHLRDFPKPAQRLPFCKRYMSGSVVGTRALRYRLVLLFSDVEVPILNPRCVPWHPESRSQNSSFFSFLFLTPTLVSVFH